MMTFAKRAYSGARLRLSGTHYENCSEYGLCRGFFANVTRPSVCHRSVVCLSSVTFVHPTQPVGIFGNFSLPFDTLAIR